MTLKLDLSPEVEDVLEAKAARLGMPLDRYALGVLRRDAEADGSDYLRELDNLYAELEANGFKGVDGAELVRAGREERMVRLAGA